MHFRMTESQGKKGVGGKKNQRCALASTCQPAALLLSFGTQKQMQKGWKQVDGGYIL